MRTLSMLVVPLAVFGCDKSNQVTVDLREATAQFAALISLDANGAPVRMSDTFGLQDGALTFGEPPLWNLENDESTLVAVTVSDEQLNGLYGTYAPADGQIVVRLENQPAARRLLPPGFPEVWLDGSIGPNASIIPASGNTPEPVTDYPALQAQVHVRLPVDPEPCLPNDNPALYPYGPTLDGLFSDLGRGLDAQQTPTVARLDDRHALVGGPGLFVIRRGERAQIADGWWIPPELLWPDVDGFELNTIVLLPPDGGPRRGIVVARGIGRSYVHEISYAPEEGLQYVKQLASVPFQLRSGDLNVNLDFVAAGLRGQVVFGNLESTEIRQNRIVGNIEKVSVVRWTDQEDAPVAVGADSAIYTATPDLTGWVRNEISSLDIPLVGEPPDITELVKIPERDEVWAGGGSGLVLVRQFASDWNQLILRMPPRSRACAIPMSDLEDLRSLYNVDAIATGDGFIFVTLENCNSVIAMRLQDQCISVLSPGGGLALLETTRENRDKQLRDAIYEEGELLVVGDEGRMLTNIPPP